MGKLAKTTSSMIETYDINEQGKLEILVRSPRSMASLLVVELEKHLTFAYEFDEPGLCHICECYAEIRHAQNDFVWLEFVCLGCARQVERAMEKLNKPRPYLSHLSKKKYISATHRNYARRELVGKSAEVAWLIMIAIHPSDIANLIKCYVAEIIITESMLTIPDPE